MLVKRVKEQRMECLNCGKEFEAKRSTQRYCSRDCQLKGIAQGNNNIAQEIIAQENVAQEAEQIAQGKPLNYGQPDCQCKHCGQVRTNKSNAIINHGEYMTAPELVANGYTHNRVTLPGDVDYVGVCTGAYGC